MSLFLERCVIGVLLIASSIQAKSIDYRGLEIQFQPVLTKPVPPIPPLIHGPPKIHDVPTPDLPIAASELPLIPNCKPTTLPEPTPVTETQTPVEIEKPLIPSEDLPRNPVEPELHSNTLQISTQEKLTIPILSGELPGISVNETSDKPSLPTLPQKTEAIGQPTTPPKSPKIIGIPTYEKPIIPPFSPEAPAVFHPQKVESLLTFSRVSEVSLIPDSEKTEALQTTSAKNSSRPITFLRSISSGFSDLLVQEPSIATGVNLTEVPKGAESEGLVIEGNHSEVPVTPVILLPTLPPILPSLPEYPKLPLQEPIHRTEPQAMKDLSQEGIKSETEGRIVNSDNPIIALPHSIDAASNLSEPDVFDVVVKEAASEITHNSVPTVVQLTSLQKAEDALHDLLTEGNQLDVSIKPVDVIPTLTATLHGNPDLLTMNTGTPIIASSSSELLHSTDEVSNALEFSQSQSIDEEPTNIGEREGNRPEMISLPTLPPTLPSLPEKPVLPPQGLTTSTNKSLIYTSSLELPHSIEGETVLLTVPNTIEFTMQQDIIGDPRQTNQPEVVSGIIHELPAQENSEKEIMSELPHRIEGPSFLQSMLNTLDLSLQKPHVLLNVEENLPIVNRLAAVETTRVPLEPEVPSTQLPSREIMSSVVPALSQPASSPTLSLSSTLELPSEKPHETFNIIEIVAESDVSQELSRNPLLSLTTLPPTLPEIHLPGVISAIPELPHSIEELSNPILLNILELPLERPHGEFNAPVLVADNPIPIAKEATGGILVPELSTAKELSKPVLSPPTLPPALPSLPEKPKPEIMLQGLIATEDNRSEVPILLSLSETDKVPLDVTQSTTINKQKEGVHLMNPTDLPVIEVIKDSIPQPTIFEPGMSPKIRRSTGPLSFDPLNREDQPFLSTYREPVTSYETKVNQHLELEDVKPQYIPLSYLGRGLPKESIKEQPANLPAGELTKEMIGPYPIEISSNHYGVIIMSPMRMFSQITEQSS